MGHLDKSVFLKSLFTRTSESEHDLKGKHNLHWSIQTRIWANQGCALSLKPFGYPVRYSGQILVSEFLYSPSSRGCKSIQCDLQQNKQITIFRGPILLLNLNGRSVLDKFKNKMIISMSIHLFISGKRSKTQNVTLFLRFKL